MAIDAALGRLGIRPGVCTSSTRPANPYEGQVIYETDTNRTLVYDNAAWLVVADNQVLSIDTTNSRVGINDTSPSYALDVTGDINASGDLRIGGTAIGDVQTYTPTWTATGGTPTIGNGTLTGKYAVINNWCVGEIKMTLGSTSSFSGTNEWRWSLPVAAVNPIGGFPAIGASLMVDTGVSIYRGIVVYVALNKVGVYAVDNSAFSVAPTVPFTWTTNEEIYITFGYEVA